MKNPVSTLRRVVSLGLAWSLLWLAFWTIVIVIIGIVDPDSIDPGEGLVGFSTIFWPMGFFSGVVIGVLLSVGERGRSTVDLSLIRVAGWGTLGTALAQLAYLGHGDQGLVANVKMALLFSAVGGGVTMVWLVMARAWSQRRASPLPSS